MIALDKITLQFGEKVLFDEVGALIGARDRIGLVGSNGAGKTTLFRVLVGQQELDGGRVDKAGYVTLGYLPQEMLTPPGRTVYDEAASAFEDIHALQARLDAASAQLHELATDDPTYHETLQIIGELEHRLDGLEAHKMKARVEKVLLGLGFQMRDMVRDCGEFSGGWQMRIALARLLLREPSLLLLDEPTNHLDLDSLRWLESYLQSYEGALMMISHDRAFLDGLCTRIFALSRGRLETYTGNYTQYEEQSIARYEQLVQAQKAQSRKIEQTERFIERFRYKASKARQVQSRIKALDKVDRIAVEDGEAGIGFRFPPPPHSGASIIRLRGLTKRYGSQTVLQDLDLEIEKGDCIAVVGVNGAGKSTLSRILAGVEAYDSGERVLGHKVSLSYFAQHQAAELDPDKNVLDTATEGAVESLRPRVRSILGSFLFRGDDAFKPVRVLSGGEKNRLALAAMLLRPSNCLILDEPTNHLDMNSKEVLQDALREWGGTFVIVSHDRAFVDPIVNRVIEVAPGRVRSFPGNVSEYIDKVDAERAAAAKALAAAEDRADPRSALNPKERRRLEAERRNRIAPLKKEAATIEARIAEREGRIASIEQQLADPAFYKGPEAPAKLREYDKVKADLDADMHRWEKLTLQIEQAEADCS